MLCPAHESPVAPIDDRDTSPGRQSGDWTSFQVSDSTVTAVRLRFPADREFVFQIEYDVGDEEVVDVSVLVRY